MDCLLVEETDKLVNTAGNRHSQLGLGDFLLDNSLELHRLNLVKGVYSCISQGLPEYLFCVRLYGRH